MKTEVVYQVIIYMDLKLNESQTRAYRTTIKFLESDKNNMLLLGPAGSGKTTVIVTAFNGKSLKIAFCAFTNKATQVLCKIADKFSIDFNPDFMTIHKLLALELIYTGSFINENAISFTFNPTKTAYLKDYDVIIFDECSTISADLYKYIKDTHDYLSFEFGKKLKYIFLGDYWQLPPIKEERSVVFQTATSEQWTVAKLDKVMRSANNKISGINDQMIGLIPSIKKGELTDFIKDYPYNMVPRKVCFYKTFGAWLDKYMDTLQNETKDCVILTYSKANCAKTNHYIQDIIDTQASREIPKSRKIICFNIGDRCSIERPIELFSIIQKKGICELKDSLGISLYNGEIFDIIDVEDVKIKTIINKSKYDSSYFDGQKLTISRINNPTEKFQIMHVNADQVNKTRQKIRMCENRMYYLQIMSEYMKKYPILDYGYCMTIYKAQGSEYHTTFVNLNSIKWSIIDGKSDDAQSNTSRKSNKIASLFRATYTAVSRASTDLYCFWSN